MASPANYLNADPADLRRCTGLPVAALERLARADAFGSTGRTRRQALWAVRALGPEPLPLFAAAEPHRVCRRLQLLRGWSYDKTNIGKLFT